MSIRKANASRFVIPHPLLYLPYRVLSFTYFIYYIPESDIRGITEPEVHNLLQAISNLAVAGSQLGLDLINTKSIEYEPYRGHFRSGFDNPEALLAEYGWEAEVIQPGEEGANFGRYPYQLPSRDIPNVGRAFLIKAKKKG
jgi:hypothetical protein|nr:hypothetical protein [Gloeocapsa sp. UFS-A4-WI-NPMV-4B04]